MKKFICTADAAFNLTNAAEVKEELSKFGEWVENLLPRALDFIIEVALAFVVIVIGMKLIGWVRKLLKKSLEKNNADTGLVQFLDSLVKYALYILLALTILQRFGVQTTSIVAAIGSVGVAIGLALQGSLSNFAGGVIILLLKPFKVGDDNEKLSFALDVAHEYTHVQQVVSCKDSDFYKKLSGGDVELARAIVALNNPTYELMDKCMQTRTLVNVFANPIDFFNYQKYGKEIPREMYITKNTLLSSAGCTNEMQYKKIVENEFRHAFARTIEYIVEHPENVEPSILNTLMEIGTV